MSRWIELEPLIADLDKGLWGKDYDKALAEAIIQDAPSIDLADYVPKDFHEKTCEAMAKRHQADRPQGEWVYTNDPLRLDDEWACSRCGNISFAKTNYCDRCGCRMKGADND